MWASQVLTAVRAFFFFYQVTSSYEKRSSLHGTAGITTDIVFILGTEIGFTCLSGNLYVYKCSVVNI